LLDARQSSVRQHDLSTHIDAGIVGRLGALADIDQRYFDRSAVTVVGQADGICFDISYHEMLRMNFP
jgi:hypothetical protein